MITTLKDLLRAIRRRPTPQKALASVAEAWLAKGVREHRDNAGPDVSWFIHDGGGTPAKAPPWCAYFVSSCCMQVHRCGFRFRFTRTGRAVTHWHQALPEQRVDRDDIWTARDPRGLIFVRTRLTKPESDRDKALKGSRRQGHTGVVISADRHASPRTITCISGNSTGYGHDRVPGGGAVAKEVIREGDAAWLRLVGFIRITETAQGTP